MRPLLPLVAVLAVGTAITVPTLPLAHTNGSTVAIPRLLLGTGGGNGGFDALAWLSVGGTGFDTSQTYCYYFSPKRNGTPAAACSQVAIANAVSVAGVDRSALFIVSKIEPEDFGVLDVLSGFGRVVDRGILLDLSTPYVDVLMMHQAGRAAGANVRPACYNASAGAEGTFAVCRLQTYVAFQQLVAKGLARAVAVSNWQVRDLQQVFAATGTYPAALEVEVHPWWHEDSLLDFCHANNITLLNYAPVGLATAAHLNDPTVLAVAAAHAPYTPAQVIQRWGLQRTQGVLLTRSANTSHMIENSHVFDDEFVLTAAEMAALAALPQKKIFNVYCQPTC